ncbi:MAG: FHA domain-containing protein [Gammaproteobacteria bacterium]|nr:FHA domain-containing protein [Gammaproteobacteria bacterium]MDX5374284.1 FHA domain-containing protein [Gammaproteobacteria bacterium]
MTERRKGDRRRYGHRPNYPLVDSDGNLITRNRRRVVERRYRQAPVEDAVESAPAVAETTAASRLVLDLSGQEVALDAPVSGFVVGRHSDSDLRADSRTVSRRHLSISWDDGHFVVTDSSSNGTFVVDADGVTHHLSGEQLALSGSGVMYLGLPPDDPRAVKLGFRLA